MRKYKILYSISCYITIIVWAIILLLPILWMVITSLKEETKIFTLPFKWIPDPVVWRNYIEALALRPFGVYLRNTLIITFATTIGGFFSASLLGYAFARLKWFGRDKFFLFVIATMMLPFEAYMVPQYIIFSKMGLTNSFWPLILPSLFGGNPFFIFVFRQFFINLSSELEDAAKIDGCGFFGIFWRIILPQSKPAIMLFTVFSLKYYWNDFVGPTIYISSNKLYTLSMGLSTFVAEKYILWNYMMAAAITFIAPMIVLFVVAQRYFMQGVVFTGLKE